MAGRLDDFDLKILSALCEQGRMSWSDLAERIGLSQTPTLRRVRALEAENYIKGYRAVLDEARLGAAINVFVSASLDAQTDEALARFEECIIDIPEVMDCFMMTGTADYLLRVVVPDLPGFQSFISKLTRVAGVARLTTSFAVKSVVQRSTPPLDMAVLDR
ncbi:Lrp/AsnC family transcriptional regulator [Sphingosinicella rhizophila]|uniref:Lrp/AsnC family transcriptional regulator n=1 Tax=Sphingosinicella rhizophila TaxID=3050082 RepID=A0ABU3Q9V8_9SPHN|nr:Lrp/AsnC family transcriptional regulator [Sphingosinicella sp. GR2756]MDT9599725.1 Lrp/AsnC family transcriptional regulator [Sphingosinicella sp. GR2756]